MILTKIERLSDKRRYDLHINGEPSLRVHEEVLLKFGLCSGDTVSRELLASIQTAEEFFLAKKKAIEILNRRMRSEKELRDKLRSKEFHPNIISDVVAYLLGNGLLDDRVFAQTYARHILTRKPAGKALLSRELRLKGVSNALIRETVNEALDETHEIELARSAAQKLLTRKHSYKSLTSAAERNRKLFAYLYGRGFSRQTISKVLQSLDEQDTIPMKEENFPES